MVLGVFPGNPKFPSICVKTRNSQRNEKASTPNPKNSRIYLYDFEDSAEGCFFYSNIFEDMF